MRITSRGQKVLEAAYIWQSEGVAVCPAQPRAKEVLYHWRDLEVDPPTSKQIQSWFGSGVMNLAVVCGTGGLLVLDFDQVESVEAWQLKAGELATTYTEQTGRGLHLFYKVDQPITRRFLCGVEALGLGHLCIVAPSIHPGGAVYFSPDPCEPIKRTTTGEIFSLLSEIPVTDQACNSAGQSLSKAELPARAGNVKSGDIAGSDVITRIKSAIPLLAFAMSLTELRQSGGAGRYWLGKCPFHDDAKPSFWVDQVKNIWGCYSPICPGSKGGDVLNLYALANNATVNDAIRQLAREIA